MHALLPMGSPRCWEQTGLPRNDALLPFGGSTPSAHPLPASDDNRELNHPPRECDKETAKPCVTAC